MFERIFLSSMNSREADVVDVIRGHCPDTPLSVISDKQTLERLAPEIRGPVLLVSYDSGLLISGEILDQIDGAAFNFHPAPPEYPGRDPHHFAVYDGATAYGATAHEMLPAVDAGRIVAVTRFDVAGKITPHELLEAAQLHMFDMFCRVAPQLLSGRPMGSVDEQWGPRKTTRKDFHRMCEIPPDIGREEFVRRFEAFDGHEHDNLVTVIHGHTFKISKKNT